MATACRPGRARRRGRVRGRHRAARRAGRDPASAASAAPAVEAAGLAWVIGDSVEDARAIAGKVQGRRTTVPERPPLPLPPCPPGGVRIATGWVEPAYLEPDASWCVPGGEPATPLANGGAFGGKASSRCAAAARELADRLGRPVRVLFTREDTVRLGPKRPPIAASAVLDGDVLHVVGTVAGRSAAFTRALPWPYRVREQPAWSQVKVPGPPTSSSAAGRRDGRACAAPRGRADRGGRRTVRTSCEIRGRRACCSIPALPRPAARSPARG